MSVQVDPSAACGVCKYISESWDRWHFQSRTDPNVYHTVDLSEWEGSGECSCPHFQFRIRPLLVAGALKPHESRAECRHIRRANKILCVAMKRKLFEASQRRS